MDHNDYFENTKGTGVLSTADDNGKVNAAIYARPHFLKDGTVAFIMRDRLSHHPAGLVLSLRSLGLAQMPSYWDSLPRIVARVHLMTGRLDTRFTALGAGAASVLRCPLTVVEGAGHNLVLESPDAVVSALWEGITL